MIVFIDDNFYRNVEAAANDTARDGSLKVIYSHSATAASATPSTQASQSNVAIPGPS